MRSLVVYESEYGNTERIARAIAEALGKHGETRVRPLGSVGALDAEQEELEVVVVGAPTQRHGLPAATRELLESTPRGALRGVRALAFDTRYRRARWITGSAAREIGKRPSRVHGVHSALRAGELLCGGGGGASGAGRGGSRPSVGCEGIGEDAASDLLVSARSRRSRERGI